MPSQLNEKQINFLTLVERADDNSIGTVESYLSDPTFVVPDGALFLAIENNFAQNGKNINVLHAILARSSTSAFNTSIDLCRKKNRSDMVKYLEMYGDRKFYYPNSNQVSSLAQQQDFLNLISTADDNKLNLVLIYLNDPNFVMPVESLYLVTTTADDVSNKKIFEAILAKSNSEHINYQNPESFATPLMISGLKLNKYKFDQLLQNKLTNTDLCDKENGGVISYVLRLSQEKINHNIINNRIASLLEQGAILGQKDLENINHAAQKNFRIAETVKSYGYGVREETKKDTQPKKDSKTKKTLKIVGGIALLLLACTPLGATLLMSAAAIFPVVVVLMVIGKKMKNLLTKPSKEINPEIVAANIQRAEFNRLARKNHLSFVTPPQKTVHAVPMVTPMVTPIVFGSDIPGRRVG